MSDATPTSTGGGDAETDAKHKRDSFSRKLLVLIGAIGLGLQLYRIIGDYRQSRAGADWVGNILLGVIFLALAVQNSFLLIRHKERH